MRRTHRHVSRYATEPSSPLLARAFAYAWPKGGAPANTLTARRAVALSWLGTGIRLAQARADLPIHLDHLIFSKRLVTLNLDRREMHEDASGSLGRVQHAPSLLVAEPPNRGADHATKSAVLQIVSPGFPASYELRRSRDRLPRVSRRRAADLPGNRTRRAGSSPPTRRPARCRSARPRGASLLPT